MDIVKVFGTNVKRYRQAFRDFPRNLCREVWASQNIYQCNRVFPP